MYPMSVGWAPAGIERQRKLSHLRGALLPGEARPKSLIDEIQPHRAKFIAQGGDCVGFANTESSRREYFETYVIAAVFGPCVEIRLQGQRVEDLGRRVPDDSDSQNVRRF